MISPYLKVLLVSCACMIFERERERERENFGGVFQDGSSIFKYGKDR